MAHADLHTGNVIVGYTGPNDKSLPKVKLIDVGALEDPGDLAFALDQDLGEEHGVMDMIIHGSLEEDSDPDSCKWFLQNRQPKGRSSQFYSFHEAMSDLNVQLLMGKQSPASVSEKLWEKYGAFVEEKLASSPDSTNMRIQEMICKIALPRYEAMEKSAQELLNDDTDACA